MKRLLLLPVLMFGISFACDQPYEEVAGIKIGCSLGSSVDYKEYMAGNDLYGGGMVFRDIKNAAPFNLEAILYIDGLVEGLILGTPKGSSSEADFKVLVESMKSRWGDPEVTEDHRSYSALFVNNESKIVELVAATVSKSDGSMTVVYRTKKSLEAEERQEAKEKALLRKKYDGL